MKAARTVLRERGGGNAALLPDVHIANLQAAVKDLNALSASERLDFVVGIGDMAKGGTLIQYATATPILQRLAVPFYPIMGNEEHDSTVRRFLEFANRWNEGKTRITDTKYVQEFDELVMVYASPDFVRDFNDEGIDWIVERLRAADPKPVFLIVHAAPIGIYPEGGEKGVSHPGFAEVVAQPNLVAVISGDLHMDMDRINHSKQIGHVHYLHVPALERTKIPDKTRHTPMLRVFTITSGGEVRVDTYEVGVLEPLARHAYRFSLGSNELRDTP